MSRTFILSRGFSCKQELQLESGDLNTMAKLESMEHLFRRRHFEKGIIILCVRWHLRYEPSSRDVVGMMGERGVHLAHTTHRYMQRFVPEFEKRWIVMPVNPAYHGVPTRCM